MTYRTTTIRSRARATSMIRRGIAIVFAASLLLDGAPTATMAEEPASKTDKPPAAANHLPPHPTGPIQYVGPDTYILLDAEGRPQPVPGMTYEDFLAAWKKLNQTANPDSQPRFTIDSIKIDGRTHGQRAELKFEAAVHLLAQGPIDVPLGLVGAILQGEPSFGRPVNDKSNDAKDIALPKKQNSNEYLDYDPQHGGFVARMTASAGEKRLLSFDLIVPLAHDGGDITLPLNCPRCVSSSLSVIVDSAIADARTNNGAVLTKKPSPDGGTRIEVAGPTGQFRLTWQSTNTEGTSLASVLNAVGSIRVAIDGRGARSDARLTVSSFGGTFDQFRVRLPKGAKLIPDPATAGSQDPKYRITEETQPAGSKNPSDNAGQIILIELKEKQHGPVVVDLSTELAKHETGQAFELAGFEVIGAVRQFGDVALNVASDWQARWNIGTNVRQVDPGELNSSLQRSDVTAAFQYDAQPWSLGVRVSPRQSQVHVTPQYDLELLPEEARLTVRLAYQVFGARAFEFRAELDGWEMSGEQVESGGLVDQDRISTPDGTLILPLAQASSRKAEVSFSMRRPLKRDASRLQLPLPVPLADSFGTGALTVRTAIETELVPDLTSSTGLAATPTREASGVVTANANTELHFRVLSPTATFVGNRTNRSREQSAQIATRVDIGQDSAQVDQQIDYLVRYEPVKELFFKAPSDLPLDEEGFEIAIMTSANAKPGDASQRTPLHLEPSTEENEPAVSGTVRFHAVLSQPQLGKFIVSARYRIPRPKDAVANGTLPVSLLAPTDSQVTSNRATIGATQGISVSLNSKSDSSSWKSGESATNNTALSPSHEFVADRTELVLPLVLAASEVRGPSTTIVDRVWLQVWLSSEIEQDRAAFRFRTANSQTTVELPPDASMGEVEVLLDSRPAEVSSRSPGRIVIQLKGNSNMAASERVNPITHTLELRFRRPIQFSFLTRHLLTPPQIDGSTELSQVYWQIILPGDEHIVRSPEQLVSTSQWQWLGTFWGRRPAMSQIELEAWAGASPQLAPTDADNQYLFTGLLPVSSIPIVTAPRWLIVLIASSAVLVLVAGWMYLPAIARPWSLIVLILIIAAAAVAVPTAALLIAQASAIGVVLASISALISRIVSRPGRRPFGPAPLSSQRLVTPRTDSIIMPSVIAAASTAPTVTLRSSDSER
jgi:hypothetical protein